MKIDFGDLQKAWDWIGKNSTDRSIQVREDGYYLVITCQEKHSGEMVKIQVPDRDKTDSIAKITRTQELR